MFAEIAPRYDLVNRMLSGGIDVWWRHVTVSRAAPPRAGAILDVCTGTGDLALAYRAKCGPDVRVVASDFCRPMLDRGIEKSAKTGAAIEWVEADAMALPFPAAAFDLVTVAFGLRNIADTSRGLAEMARVCAPGGVVLAEFYNPYSVRYLAKKLGGAHKISETRTEAEVYTRFDGPAEVRAMLPDTLSLEGFRGVRVFTPVAKAVSIPLLGGLLARAEHLALGSPLARFGGFLVAVLRKR
jgi:ubiquinone/menaquinone biosynthesis C-methylase UbiE